MIAELVSRLESIAPALSAWLLTYAVHSALLIGGVWLAVRAGFVRRYATQDVAWKAALIGGLFTASAQSAVGTNFWGWRYTIPAAADFVVDEPVNAVAPSLPAELATSSGLSKVAPAHEITPAPVPASALEVAPPWSLRAIGIATWLTLALILLLRFAVARIRLWVRFGRREPVVVPPLLALLEALCRTANIRRPIRLTTAERLPSPVAIGRSEICLPALAVRELDREQQRSILAHELAHLERGDPAWLSLACVIERLFFFQPFNRIARRRLQDVAEYLCDDWAVRRTGSGLTLAKSLVKVAEWLQHTAPRTVPLAGMAEDRSHLVRRVERLVTSDVGTAPSLGRMAVAGVVALLLLTALVAPGIQAVQSPEPRRGGDFSEEPVPVAQQAERAVARTVPLPESRALSRPVWVPVIVPARAAEPSLAGGRPEVQDTSRSARAILALIEALRDPDAEVREAAARALGERGDARAADALARALGDSVPDVRRAATLALAEMKDRRAIEPLLAALDDSDAEVRQMAAHALGDAEDRRAIPGLMKLLQDQDAEVRQTAAHGLGEFKVKEAFEPLVRALRDADADVRQMAIWALGEIRDPRAAAGLAGSLTDTSPDVRQAAAQALGELRVRPVPQQLIDALRDSDADVRQAAAWALSEARDPRAVPGLVRLTKDEDADVRSGAIQALTEMPDSAAHQALIDALKSNDPKVRRAAADALGSDD
jgi:HEAT repeat protein/beta-lactamase regulating signal transducer with metallopeptidase domain